jgi:chemotaxis protein CheC
VNDNMVQLNDLVAGRVLDNLLPVAMANAARGLSEMLGRTVTIDVPRVEMVPIGRVADHVGGPETEMVGIYLLICGEMPGQAILMASLEEALRLADLLLGEPEGTTQQLGDLERSALAEAGNLTVSFFLNAIASSTGISSRPSPPAVMVDMLGAIIGVVAAPMAAYSDELLIVETDFQESGRTVSVHFWVLPYPESLDL